MRSISSLLRLILCILLCEAAGIVGSVFTAPALPTWYADLNRPAISPPNWLFAPVWTMLYLLMGISLYLVLEERGRKDINPALAAFSIQLLLNASWSYFFFGLQSTLYGFIAILAVLAAVVITIITFMRISRRAVVLLIPYLAWVSFATLVAYQLWQLNP